MTVPPFESRRVCSMYGDSLPKDGADAGRHAVAVWMFALVGWRALRTAFSLASYVLACMSADAGMCCVCIVEAHPGGFLRADSGRSDCWRGAGSARDRGGSRGGVLRAPPRLLAAAPIRFSIQENAVRHASQTFQFSFFF